MLQILIHFGTHFINFCCGPFFRILHGFDNTSWTHILLLFIALLILILPISGYWARHDAEFSCDLRIPLFCLPPSQWFGPESLLGITCNFLLLLLIHVCWFFILCFMRYVQFFFLLWIAFFCIKWVSKGSFCLSSTSEKDSLLAGLAVNTLRYSKKSCLTWCTLWIDVIAPLDFDMVGHVIPCSSNSPFDIIHWCHVTPKFLDCISPPFTLCKYCGEKPSVWFDFPSNLHCAISPMYIIYYFNFRLFWSDCRDHFGAN